MLAFPIPGLLHVPSLIMVIDATKRSMLQVDMIMTKSVDESDIVKSTRRDRDEFASKL